MLELFRKFDRRWMMTPAGLQPAIPSIVAEERPGDGSALRYVCLYRFSPAEKHKQNLATSIGWCYSELSAFW